MVIKCKMCGGELAFAEGSTVCECEYCGSRQTIPNIDNEKKGNLFNRANRLRMNSEFDKAAALYESIAAEFPEEAEAYWGLCLCAYGIEYVDDPATGRKLPTCHRTLPISIMEDANFEQACDYADAVARRVYRDEAKAIDRIQKDILAIAANEAPYDVFICYKETDDHGDRTEDSVLAQDIYDALTGKGLKVFFSRITLEDKLGVQYEPYIYAALSSAKVLLAVGTQFEYYDAVWVKNEWSRYLGMMKSDRTKSLIPCFKGLDAYDMPKEFKGLQAQDMGKLGWLQDLVRGVEKLCGKEPAKQTTQVVTQVVREVVKQGNGDSVTVENLLKRARIFQADGEWQKADEYFDKVLDIFAECAPAYVGKLCVKLQLKKEEELAEQHKEFSGDGLWTKAKRFATDEQPAVYESYEAAVLANMEEDRRQEEKKRRRAEEAKRRAEEEKRKEETRRADQLRYEQAGKRLEEQDYVLAYHGFKQLGDHSDSRKRSEECIEKWTQAVRGIYRSIREEMKEVETITAELSQLKGLFNGKKRRPLQERLEILHAKLENDKADLKKHGVGIDQVSDLSEGGKPTKRELALFEAAAQAAYVAQFEVGKTVTLGSYGGEPIEWLVLATKGDTRIMISVKGQDAVCFNKSDSDGNEWKTSYVRSWLNGTFYKEAFSEAEKAQLTTGVTGDRVYLLSVDEAERYFGSDLARVCYPTETAKKNGAYSNSAGACWWWLRSPGSYSVYAAFVSLGGSVNSCGNFVYGDDGAVRPVVSLRLS